MGANRDYRVKCLFLMKLRHLLQGEIWLGLFDCEIASQIDGQKEEQNRLIPVLLILYKTVGFSHCEQNSCL